MSLYSQLLGGLRQENCLNPGGGGCGEPRLRHCTPAWVTRANLCLKKKKQKKTSLSSSEFLCRLSAQPSACQMIGAHLMSAEMLRALYNSFTEQCSGFAENICTTLFEPRTHLPSGNALSLIVPKSHSPPYESKAAGS